MEFRKAEIKDRDAVWRILQAVNAGEDSFAFSPNMSESEMLEIWMSAEKHTYVADFNGEVVGTFYIKDNQPGLGSHIANAGYAVLPQARGKGIGRAMCEFSLLQAKELGYEAMQFNLVVKTNANAVNLWKKLGFEIIGEVPEAFRHARHGLVNAYIMHRKL
jgi:ribosomal protein S18 acetylase RimI-like enzyme